MNRTNWAGNVAWAAVAREQPSTADEVQAVVGRAAPAAHECRVVGRGHSFNRLADTTGTHLDLSRLDGMELIGSPVPGANVVRIGGGVVYARLGEFLHRAGWALRNLASLPHITVAGAVATATHGSGDGNGHLGTSVRAVELVDGGGALRRFERGDPDFPGVVVSLGALGAVVALELDVEPTYDVAQEVWHHLPLAALIESFDAVMGSAHSVSCFTRWRRSPAGSSGIDGLEIDQLWRKFRVVDDRADGFDPTTRGAFPAERECHPVDGMDPAPCTTQGGRPGPWHRRLPHFRPEHTPSAGHELQAEVFVARRDIGPVLSIMAEVADMVAPVLLVSEIRSIAPDDAWLSPTGGEPAVAIHFTFEPDGERVSRVLAAVEDALAPFAAVPHWGKLTTRDPGMLSGLWGGRLERFAELRRRLDPAGVWLNDHLRELLSAAG